MRFIEAFESIGNLIYMVKARVSPLRDMGLNLLIFNSVLSLQGLKILRLRMERNSENALK